MIFSLLKQLSADYPDIVFDASERFSWSPDTKVIQYIPNGDPAELLHELAHAKLQHASYTRDIALIRMEREAWEVASKELSSRYHIPVLEDFVEEHLDSYREWLHARSTCPTCRANGFQVDTQLYQCSACQTSWRVNEARLCGLKRYKIHP